MAIQLSQFEHPNLVQKETRFGTPSTLPHTYHRSKDSFLASELKKAVDGGQAQQQRGGLALARTSDRHLAGEGPAWRGAGSADLLYRIPDQPSLDGNTVDMDRERTQFADNAVRYQAALTIMNRRIQGLKNAMQPE